MAACRGFGTWVALANVAFLYEYVDLGCGWCFF